MYIISIDETKKAVPSKLKQETVKPKVEEIHAARQNKPHKPVNSPDRKQQLSGNDKVPDRKPIGKESQKPADKPPVQSAPKDSKKSKKKSQIKETSAGLPKVSPSVPKLEKATPYEFITSWNSLKKSASFQPYYDLLRQIPSKDLSSGKLDHSGNHQDILCPSLGAEFRPYSQLKIATFFPIPCLFSKLRKVKKILCFLFLRDHYYLWETMSDPYQNDI